MEECGQEVTDNTSDNRNERDITGNYYDTGNFYPGEQGVRVEFSWLKIIGQYLFWFGSFYAQYKVCLHSISLSPPLQVYSWILILLFGPLYSLLFS